MNKEMKSLMELLRDTVYGHEFSELAFMANTVEESLNDLRAWIMELQAENKRLKENAKDVRARIREIKYLFSKPINTVLKKRLLERRVLTKCGDIEFRITEALKED